MRRTVRHTTNAAPYERLPGGRTLGKTAVAVVAVVAMLSLLATEPALALAGAFVAGACLGTARERR
jgi:small-conductance mechanosensitive channel